MVVNSGKQITDRSARVAFSIAAAFLFFISSAAYSQFPHIDDSIFAAKIKQAKAEKIDTLPIGERVAAMGKLFLGTPYVAHTLDSDATKEQLVVDLRGFDCVTFYENALALARLIKEYPNPTVGNLRGELRYLRYRDADINGFHSRLNYTIDYFYADEKKFDVLRDVTRKIGGEFVKFDDREINFMTTHRSLYKQLASDVEYNAMLQIEKDIHARKDFYYIPKADVAAVESKIETGDILGITTNIDGLDCSHTGIAIRMHDGKIHFMHASNLMGKVIISNEPLSGYLTHSTHQTGVIIARPETLISFKPSFE